MAGIVIGTAGHVDHGKTALIRALTGQDTDRLPEEKRRGISIDLGFAAFPLPSGRVAGIVDVPGHERFVHNMVAGVAGMDAVLLVVAADEGVMPQTREHLDILQLLGVRRGIVVLTKVDLCEPEWVDLVEEEVRAAVAGTFLADAPILRVSSVTGEGLEALKDAVDRLVPTVPARPESGYARLPVDRVFTAPGFGTVVTGTLLSGRVRGEDRLELLPAGRTVRVRQVQVHGQPVDAAVAGNRVALNLVGVERHEVARGDVLITPGALRAGDLLAVRVDVLARAPAPLRNEQRVRVHAGTAEVVARALVLDGEAVEPGAGGYVLFRAERPLVVARGDRILLRTLSPVATLGGGVVLDTGRRYRRGDAEGLRELALRASGRDEDIVGTILAAGRPVTPQAVARRVGAPLEAVLPVLESLVAGGKALRLTGADDGGTGEWLLAAAAYQRLREDVSRFLARYFESFPLRRWAPREELRAAVWPREEPRAFAAALRALARDGAVTVEGERVGLPGRQVSLSPEQERAVAAILADLRAAGLTPPNVAALAAAASAAGGAAAGPPAELLRYLVESDAVERVDEDLFFAREALEAARERVRRFLQEREAMTVADLRDLLGITRKYAVPLAEYFDRIHLTRRHGDLRRLA